MIDPFMFTPTKIVIYSQNTLQLLEIYRWVGCVKSIF